jgi:hypothetical protein
MASLTADGFDACQRNVPQACNRFGGLAKLAATRRASSLVSSLLTASGGTPTGLILEIDVSERLPVGVADNEAGIGLLDGPGRSVGTGGARSENP